MAERAGFVDPFAAKDGRSAFIDPFAAPATDAQKVEAGTNLSDLPVDFAGSAVGAVGSTVRGLGEGARLLAKPIVAGVNAAAGRDVLSEPVNPLRAPAELIEGAGKSISDSTSQAYRDQVAATTPTGDIFDPASWGTQGDPTLLGGAGQLARGLGSVAPMVVGAVATGGGSVLPQLATATGLAAAQGGGFASASEEERIKAMPQADLDKLPGYQALLASGLSPTVSRETLALETGQSAFNTTAPISAASGLILGGPLSKPVQAAIARGIGGGAGRRALVEGAGEALLEGAQEVTEQAAQTYGANAATGETRSLTEDSLANFVLGAGTGGVLGTGAALMPNGQAAEPAPAPAPAPASPAPQAPPPPVGPLSRVADAVAKNPGLAPAPEPDQQAVKAQADAAKVQAKAQERATIAQEKAAQKAAEKKDAADAPREQRALATAAAASLANPEALSPPWVDTVNGVFNTPNDEQILDHYLATVRAQKAAGTTMRTDAPKLAAEWGVTLRQINKARTGALKELALTKEVDEKEARAAQRDQDQRDLEDVVRGTATAQPIVDPFAGGAPNASETAPAAQDAQQGRVAVVDPAASAEYGAEAESTLLRRAGEEGSAAPIEEGGQARADQQVLTAAQEPINANETVQGDPERPGDTAVAQESAPPAADAAPPPPALDQVATDDAEGLDSGSQAAVEVAGGVGSATVATVPAGAGVAVDDGAPDVGPASPAGLTAAPEADKRATKIANLESRERAGTLNKRAAGELSKLRAAVVDEAAAAAAQSPANDRPEPTQAQKEAGNYAKGHVKINGLDVSIETRDAVDGKVALFSTPDAELPMAEVSDRADFSAAAPGSAPAPSSPAHTLAVAREVADLTKGWGSNRPKVNVLRPEDYGRLPASVRAIPNHEKALGVVSNGQVWLLAGNLRLTPNAPNDPGVVKAVLTHEAVGHWGLERILNDHVKGGWDRMAADIKALRESGRGSEAMRSVLDSVSRRYPTASDTVLAKETIAVMAERGIRNGLLDRVVAAVRAFLRKHFPNIKFSEAEVRQLLVKSDAYLRADGQSAPAGAMAPAMSTPASRAATVLAMIDPKLRSDPLVREYVERAARVDAEEKQSDPSDWSPELRALDASGDWRAFSKARGYTDAEIDNFGKYMKAANGVIAKYGDQVMDDIRSAELNVDTLASAPAPIFYSALAESVQTAKGAPKTANAKAWKEWLDGRQRNGEFKGDERAWLDLDGWLDAQGGNVTREQLAAFVRANEVQVSETVLGQDASPEIQSRIEAVNAEYNDLVNRHGPISDMPAAAKKRIDELDAEHDRLYDEWRAARAAVQLPKFAGYQLPGGKNYRELLITMPGEQSPITEQADPEFGTVFAVGTPRGTFRYTTREAAEQAADSEGRQQYRSSHWDQPNVLAHIRFNERTSADGARTLLVEEVQSDWHQAGRKEGYVKGALADQPMKAIVNTSASEPYWEVRTQAGVFVANVVNISPDSSTPEQAIEEARSLARRRNTARGIPDAPFKTTWPMLAFKRAVRWAAENGFDRVAWTPGEQQAARYDLSKQVDRIQYDPATRTFDAYKDGAIVMSKDATPEELPDIIGKEAAERLLKTEPTGGRKGNKHELAGVDLKFGGDGMKAFYDKMLPNEVGKWAKKFGAKVGQAEVERAGESSIDDDGNIVPVTDTVHSMDITPSMRESVLGGQPLFSKPDESIAAIDEARANPDASGFARAKEWLGEQVAGRFEGSLPALLGTLQTRHVLELAEGHTALKGAQQFADHMQSLDTDRQMQLAGSPDAAEHPTDMLKRGVGPLADRWAKFRRMPGIRGLLGGRNPAEKAMVDVMHAATRQGLDPSKEYQRLTMRDSTGKLVSWTRAMIRERILAIRGQMRGRPGDDKTEMIAEIKYLRALPKRERRREAAWGPLVASYQALTPEAQEIYADTRDWYAQHSEAVQDALMERIEALELPEQQKRQTLNAMRLEFESNRLEGVYFPLDRNGDYWISALGPDNVQVYEMFETATEFAKRAKDLRARGYDIQASGRKDTELLAKNAPSGSFVADVLKPLRASNAPEKVLDEIYQVFLKSLPEMSMRKRFVHRKVGGVEGFSGDAHRAFSKNGFHGAHQLAKLRWGHKLEATVAAMQKSLDNFRKSTGFEAGGPDDLNVVRGDSLLGEIKRRLDWIMSPKDSRASNIATSIGFLYYMGASPAAALVNMTQGAIVTLPALGAKYGWDKATRAMTRATADAARTMGNTMRVLTDENEKRAYRVMETRGDFDRSQAHALAAMSEGNELRSAPAWQKTMQILGLAFHKAEVINREVAGMAAFRLATADGADFDTATRYASEVINSTHYDYSSANRSRYMTGNVAKVALQFKSYAVATTWMLYRNLYQSIKGETPEVRRLARRTLTGVMGMTALFAGSMGLPLINLIKYTATAAAMAFGDDDDPWDFETEFRGWLNDHFGTAAGSVIADGPLNRTGIDLASRTSMSNLWIRDSDRELEGRDAYYAMLESLAGPMGGLVKNLYVGTKQIDDGHTWRGVETMLPKFIKDAMKGVRLASEGATSLRGDPIVRDVNAAESLAQAIGFRPTRVADQSRINSALKGYEQFIQSRRQTLMNALAMSIQNRNDDARQRSVELIASFNRNYPEIAIDRKAIVASLRQRARLTADAESGILLNRKLSARVRDAVGVDTSGSGARSADR